MMGRLEQAIHKQYHYIETILAEPLRQAARICARHWQNRAQLDQALSDYLKANQKWKFRLLYAIDEDGRQRSSNISEGLIDQGNIGQDLSLRPYLEHNRINADRKFMLSDVYVDRQTHRPCITALHLVELNGEAPGYLAADFDLKDLRLRNVDVEQLQEWRQIKGDPSIRNTLFQQTRSRSAMDERLDEVLDVIKYLITEQGVFHAKIHFSSSRATLWLYNDPYHYRLHVLEEIINPGVCLVYAKTPYPEQASVAASVVPEVLRVFKALREADETIYLRAASLNIMNGMVGLNFSCDGTHYMQAHDFLDKDLNFWLGDDGQKAACSQ